MQWPRVFRALKRAAIRWLSSRLPRRAAGLAFYTAFSVAPMLMVLSLAIQALFRTSEGEVLAQVLHILPGSGQEAVEVLLDGLRQRKGSGVAAVAGTIGLVFGATGMFMALQDALDDVWAETPDPQAGILEFITRRLFSFAMLMAVGFLLLVSLVLNAGLTLAIARFGVTLAGGEALWYTVNVVVALAMATAIFTLLFRLVPKADVPWDAALAGGVVAALLFRLGEGLIGWYLGDAARLSVYGVFGSLIVLLLWVYYSAQILLFGAAVTHEYAQDGPAPKVRTRRGSGVVEGQRPG